MRDKYKSLYLSLLSCVLVLFARTTYATPTIYLQWDEGGQFEQPEEGTDYTIDTSSPASPEFPDVKLITGRLDWRIWSVDTSNPNDIGDIGVISSPHAENFAVKILDDSNGPGARHVKAIRLEPTSSSNYSSIPNGNISGQLLDELIVQANTSDEGGGIGDLVLAGMAATTLEQWTSR